MQQVINSNEMDSNQMRGSVVDTVRNLKKLNEDRDEQKTSDTNQNKSFKRNLTFEEQLAQIQNNPQPKTPLKQVRLKKSLQNSMSSNFNDSKTMNIAKEIIQHNETLRKSKTDFSELKQLQNNTMSQVQSQRQVNRKIVLKRSKTSMSQKQKQSMNNLSKRTTRRQRQKMKKQEKVIKKCIVKDPLKLILQRSRKIKVLLDEGEFDFKYVNQIQKSKPFQIILRAKLDQFVQAGRLNPDMKHMKKDIFTKIEKVLLNKISTLQKIDKTYQELEKQRSHMDNLINDQIKLLQDRINKQKQNTS